MMITIARIFTVLALYNSICLVRSGAAPNNTTPSGSQNSTSTAITSPQSNSTDNSKQTIVATAVVAGSYGVSGQFTFTLGASNDGVSVKIDVDGLMEVNSTAAFGYHIHTNPISSDGNCTSALAHLDPLRVTDAFVCNATQPEFCQIGDLSGRNGKLPGNVSVANVDYVDRFLRFWPQPFSLLGRSIVIHAPNTTRIACGNITSVIDGTADSQGKPTNQSSNYVTKYSTRAPPATNSTGVHAEPLPTVTDIPNVILSMKPSSQSNGTSSSGATVPAAIPAPTNFTYTSGAKLPSQDDINILNGTSGSFSSPAKNNAGSNSAAGKSVQIDSGLAVIISGCLMFLKFAL